VGAYWSVWRPFDNGTSLGYEQSEAALRAPWSRGKLEAYVAKGTHHCGWSQRDIGGVGHTDLCRLLCTAHPDAGAAIESVIRLADSDVDKVLEWCTEFDRFSDQRAQFVGQLVKARRDRIAGCINR
jgi:hypothetical protein